MQTQPRHGDCCQGDNIKEQPSLIRIPSEREREGVRESQKDGRKRRGKKTEKGDTRKETEVCATASEEVQRRKHRQVV